MVPRAGRQRRAHGCPRGRRRPLVRDLHRVEVLAADSRRRGERDRPLVRSTPGRGCVFGGVHSPVTIFAAYDRVSTWSSCLPFGNVASSSHHSSSHTPSGSQSPHSHPVVSAGNHTRPAWTRPAAGMARVTLSVSAIRSAIGIPAACASWTSVDAIHCFSTHRVHSPHRSNNGCARAKWSCCSTCFRGPVEQDQVTVRRDRPHARSPCSQRTSWCDAATSTVPNRQQSASVTIRPSRSIRSRPSPGHGGSSRQYRNAAGGRSSPRAPSAICW